MKRPPLIRELQCLTSLRRAREILAERGEVAVGGMWGASHAAIAAAMAIEEGRPLLLIAAGGREAEEAEEDLRTLTGRAPFLLPELEMTSAENPLAWSDRLRTVMRIRQADRNGCPIVVASGRAALEPLPPPSAFDGGDFRIAVGDRLEIEPLFRRLVENGFTRCGMVERPGEFSVRGAIIDLFPYAEETPLRVELDGDTVVSLRLFDVATQGSGEERTSAVFSLLGWSASSSDAATIFDYLTPSTIVAIREPEDINVHARVDEIVRRSGGRPRMFLRVVPSDQCTIAVESLQRFSGRLTNMLEELAALAASVDVVTLLCANDGEERRLRELLAAVAPVAEKVVITHGRLSRGFLVRETRRAYLPNHELFNRYVVRRRSASTATGRRASGPSEGFFELREGDYVVHADHGIGRFLGIERIERGGGAQDYLAIEYDGGTKLSIPVSDMAVVQKYVGGTGVAPPLSRLGGSGWTKKKEAALKAAEKLASEMMHIQALREMRPGIAYPSETEWERELEASFPFEETPDQTETWGAIRGDMEVPKPSDRLICGDVGYGKTELAVRAAFKASLAGKQAAVLVPTTVLAQQHVQTFRERLADFPVSVDVLSRFKSRSEQRETLKRLAEGGIDVIIGTHRLLQSDVKFRELGLVVIDEEQRFSVEHKERFKRLRATVDVLTLTATPIPRTLHLSLLGIRDISALTTPPRDRLAIRTEVLIDDDRRVREAILFELERGGQVFFVHNRVYNIAAVADRLRRIVPEAVVGVAHGQMDEEELEERMLEFLEKRVDVLIATTIIESGLDIPNANTIIIDDADRYGLATLHQLRGRVGRDRRQAFAYLLLPRDRMIPPQARRRLKAIEEFNELGAGFRIAMRDLEIRGVGNILGSEQHGHIAAVGYDLYCRMLERAVKRERKQKIEEAPETTVDLDLEAYLPDEYTGDRRAKVAVYRRIVRCRSEEEIGAVRREMEDRFGPLPVPAETLLEVQRLKILAGRHRIVHIDRLKEAIVLKCADSASAAALKRRFPSLIRRVGEEELHVVSGGGDDVAILKNVLGKA